MIAQDVFQTSVSETVVKTIPGIDAVILHGVTLLSKKYNPNDPSKSVGAGYYPSLWVSATGKPVCDLPALFFTF